MKRYMSHIIRSWRSHGVVQLATCVVLSGVFSVISFSLLVHQNLEGVFHQWGNSVQVSVYLKDQMSDGSLGEVRDFIERSPYFKDIKYVSKAEAFKSFQNQTSEYIPDFVFNKDFGNPLPASFEMKLAGDLGSSTWLKRIKNFTSELKVINGVEDITYGQGWVDNYASFLWSFSYVSGSLIFVLLAGSLFIIGNSIRSSMSQRQGEIEILELVGATASSIRKPYIVDGLFMGALAAIISLLTCYLLYLWQSQVLQNYLSFWNVTSHLSFLNLPRVLIILVMGALFGALGSWLCVSRMNNGWAATRGSRRF